MSSTTSSSSTEKGSAQSANVRTTPDDSVLGLSTGTVIIEDPFRLGSGNKMREMCLAQEVSDMSRMIQKLRTEVIS